MRRGFGHRVATLAAFAIALWAAACGKVEPKTGGEPDGGGAYDASGSSDVRGDSTIGDATHADTNLDAPSTSDAGADVARDSGGGGPTNDSGPTNDGGPPPSDGSMSDRAVGPDVERDAPSIIDAPLGDAPGDGRNRCVLGQSKVGDCTL